MLHKKTILILAALSVHVVTAHVAAFIKPFNIYMYIKFQLDIYNFDCSLSMLSFVKSQQFILTAYGIIWDGNILFDKQLKYTVN